MSEGETAARRPAAPGINPVTGQPLAGELDAGDLERLNELIDPSVLADEVRPGERYDLAGASMPGPGEASGPSATTGPHAPSTSPAGSAAPATAAQTGAPKGSDPKAGEPAQASQSINPLAAALSLLLASPPHRHLFLADLEWRLLPAIAAGQFRLITKEGRPLAFVTWAFLSDEIRDRLKTAMSQPGGASSGAGRLKPEEWRSGKHHVIVDFVSPFITDEEEKKRMLASVFGEQNKGSAG